MENVSLILVSVAGGIAIGVYVMHLLSHSKTVDARGEAIKAVNAAVTLVAKLPNEDDVIADANARKAANAVALDALKAKIASL